MLVLGLDPGLVVTGYALVDIERTGRAELVESGDWRPPRNAPNVFRIRVIADALVRLCYGSGLKLVGIEDYTYQGRTVTNAAPMQALVRELGAACVRASTPYLIVAAGQARMALGLHPSASKGQYRRNIERILSAKFSNQHRADAAATAIAAARRHRVSSALDRATRERG